MYTKIPILPLLVLLLLNFIDANAQSGQSNLLKVQDKNKPIRPILEFFPEGGFYDEALEVELFAPGCDIYYTTDGSKPGRTKTKYRKPIKVRKTLVIRAVAYRGKIKSKLGGFTYFIDEPESTFPIVSLGVNPETLFDPERGLYMKGPNAVDSLWTKDGANFWSRKEVRIHTEIYENGNDRVFSSGTGLRLFGGISRLFPQKSMTIVARDRYGKKRIRHPVFGEDGLKKFKFLVFRNSGSDWGKSHFRDGLMTSLVEDWDIEKQDFRPSQLYINGKYWGIYNIREKVNRYFIEGHQDIDNDSIDLIEHRMTLKRGSRGHYVKMLRYIKKHSMRNPAHYQYICSQMEVENFMDHQIAQIYFDNQDAGGNIKFWRPQKPNGRWRWILYDTDFGFGLHNPTAYTNNSLAFHTKPDGPDWPNPPWSTFLLRNLLGNSEFQRMFVNRFADRINTSFAPENVMQKIDAHYEKLLPEIPRHLKRWRLKKKRWEKHVNILRKFARLRPDHMRMHLMERFKTGDAVELSMICTNGGKILLNNNLQVEGGTVFRGKYFENYPIHLKAQPQFGYRFSHWEGLPFEEAPRDLSVKLEKDKPLKLKAVFERYIHPLAEKLIINEVSANNKKSGDWIELYNSTKETISLNNWVFTDGKNEFRIPDVSITGKSYLVLCEDSTSFYQQHPEWIKVAGNFTFGLNKRRESLGLYTDKGASVDSTSYVLAPMDSTFVWSHLLPHLDNGDRENWEVRLGIGTPGGPNPYYLESHIKAEQEMWVRIGVSIGVLLCCFLVFQLKKRRQPTIIVTRQKEPQSPKPPPKNPPTFQ
ncbi:MAG: CotH kinase family protein [Bacteroidota bacterium]